MTCGPVSRNEADSFEGRDLLVGRPEEGGGKPGGGAAKSPAGTKSPQSDAHDDTIADILATVWATASRIDAL